MEEAKLFIGGVAWETNNDSLRKAFEEFGEVTSGKLPADTLPRVPA
jgi:RNA recognition motif-containing protein